MKEKKLNLGSARHLRQNVARKNEELALILDFVERYRRENNIAPSRGRKFELSCEAFGEGYNLLYRQLIPTIEGSGGWEEIEDEKVRQEVLNQIKKDSQNNLK
jgi:hypothetical protein